MPQHAIPGPHNGAVLVSALFVLIAVLIVGVSAAQTALNAEKAARNERDRHIAFQAAEAALADAERDIEGGNEPQSARAALFAADNAIGFADGCGQGLNAVNLGLCSRAGQGGVAAWLEVDLANAGSDSAAITVPYGKFTGASLPVGMGTLPLRAPRYLIELVPYARAGEDAAERPGNFYRITAIGFGSRAATTVVLQSFYRRVAAVGEAP